MGQQYYSILNLLSEKAEYNLLLGERSNGKSYATKYCSLWEAYYEKDYFEHFKNKKDVQIKRYQLGYIRRWKDETKANDIERYFDDMPIKDITNNEYSIVIAYRNDIYFGNVDEKGKKIRGKKIGSVFAVNMATHYKSLSFPHIRNLIYEEFLTKDGYLAREVENLTSIISTIARREYVRVFLIGNSVNRYCPYFNEWELTHVKQQKIGTIDIYNQHTDQYDDSGNQIVVKIAVEYCANSGSNTKMFFGNKSKSITSGVWDTNTYPHLTDNLNTYKRLYQVKYIYNDFGFIIQLLKNVNNEPFLYVYPSTKENSNVKRIVSNIHSIDVLTTYYLTELTKYDKLVLKLLNDNKVVYSDNLCGTEFNQIRKERGKF